MCAPRQFPSPMASGQFSAAAPTLRPSLPQQSTDAAELFRRRQRQDLDQLQPRRPSIPNLPPELRDMLDSFGFGNNGDQLDRMFR